MGRGSNQGSVRQLKEEAREGTREPIGLRWYLVQVLLRSTMRTLLLMLRSQSYDLATMINWIFTRSNGFVGKTSLAGSAHKKH